STRSSGATLAEQLTLGRKSLRTGGGATGSSTTRSVAGAGAGIASAWPPLRGRLAHPLAAMARVTIKAVFMDLIRVTPFLFPLSAQRLPDRYDRRATNDDEQRRQHEHHHHDGHLRADAVDVFLDAIFFNVLAFVDDL